MCLIYPRPIGIMVDASEQPGPTIVLEDGTAIDKDGNPVDISNSNEMLQTTQSHVSLDSTQAVVEVTQEDLNLIHPKESTLIEQDLNPSLKQFMVACQEGDLAAVKSLTLKVNVDDTFSDGITGLHWASINNRTAIVQYLVDERKATVDIYGGELRASALHWACRNGLVDIVHYLLSRGANPTAFDSQHYNALHLAIHSSNILLVIYMLYRFVGAKDGYEMYVDEPDKENRTSLHWACYQGDVLSVQCLIKFGADINKVDNSLFLPLHWSFMKPYKPILKLLLDTGSDIFVRNDQGKNSFDIAKDMNCTKLWIKTLNELFRYELTNWQPKVNMFSNDVYKRITFFSPYIMLGLVFKINSWNLGFGVVKLFVTVLIIGLFGYLLRNYIVANYVPDKAITKSPFSSGIFSAALFWVTCVYLFKLLPTLIFTKYFLMNILLGIILGIVAFTFYKSMILNPGFISVPTDNTKIYKDIVELISLGKFDNEHFCINTFIRKPVRSKYSHYNKKLIARFDHFCPWIYNEVGVRNHKIFMMFVYSLSVGILLFSYLALRYFDRISDGYDSDDEEQRCSILSEKLCQGYIFDSFTFNLLIFCWIQLLWIAMLIATQTFQILKGVTTFEFAQIVRSQGFSHQQGVLSNPCIRILGIDQFFLTAKITILQLLNQDISQAVVENRLIIPSDFGIKQNWTDFWFLGDIKLRNIFYLPMNGESNLNGELVDYYTLYEYPQGV